MPLPSYKFKANDKQGGPFITLEPDTYDASYLSAEEYNGGQYGPTLKLTFLVASDQGDMEIKGFAGLPKNGFSFGTKSKLRNWIEAMLGRPLADGEEIDLASLANTPCRVLLDVIEKPDKDEAGKDIVRTYNKILKVLPVRKRAGKPAQAKADEALY